MYGPHVTEFMVACTQFMNIIVHSVENVNYRVHLQYELTALGLDDFLETLKDNESERLTTQVRLFKWSLSGDGRQLRLMSCDVLNNYN